MFDVVQRFQQLRSLLLHLFAHRTGRRGEDDPNRHVAAAYVDVLIFDEAQAYDVAMEVRVLDLAESGEYLLLADLSRGLVIGHLASLPFPAVRVLAEVYTFVIDGEQHFVRLTCNLFGLESVSKYTMVESSK